MCYYDLKFLNAIEIKMRNFKAENESKMLCFSLFEVDLIND